MLEAGCDNSQLHLDPPVRPARYAQNNSACQLIRNEGYIYMNYNRIIKHYETCLEAYGDTPLGMDWPNEQELLLRYDVMLDIVTCPGTFLDFGCGTARILSYIRQKGIDVNYTGLDASEKFIAVARSKFKETTFLCQDVLTDPLQNRHSAHPPVIIPEFTSARPEHGGRGSRRRLVRCRHQSRRADSAIALNMPS